MWNGKDSALPAQQYRSLLCADYTQKKDTCERKFQLPSSQMFFQGVTPEAAPVPSGHTHCNKQEVSAGFDE